MRRIIQWHARSITPPPQPLAPHQRRKSRTTTIVAAPVILVATHPERTKPRNTASSRHFLGPRSIVDEDPPPPHPPLPSLPLCMSSFQHRRPRVCPVGTRKRGRRHSTVVHQWNHGQSEGGANSSPGGSSERHELESYVSSAERGLRTSVCVLCGSHANDIDHKR